MYELKICLVGFGNASREFCRILLEKSHWLKDNYDHKIIVSAICTKNRGTIINRGGIDLSKALHEVETNHNFYASNKDFVNLSTQEAIKASEADILVELSSLSIRDGQPAISHIETAILNNMHIITANKGPIAWDFTRLKNLSRRKNIQFFYETTVMDGTPIFNLVNYTLPGCKILGFKGILNSTTNFILEQMEHGNSFESALREAQRLGFAEADATLDVNGYDAAAKTAALLNVLMDGDTTPDNINTIGIAGITKEDIINAGRENKKIKLLCEGFIEENVPKGRVYPSYFDNNNIFSNIDSTSSILTLETDMMGELTIIEKNPAIRQTGYGIFSDLLNLIRFKSDKK